MRSVFDRPIRWGDDGQTVVVIDQTRLPHSEVTATWRTLDDAVEGIRSMQVRGAPLIGVAAAHGMALAVAADPAAVDVAYERLAATRPTAINLRWALDRCRVELAELEPAERAAAAHELADRLTSEEVASSRAIGEIGADLIAAVHERTGAVVQVLTHCNAGVLATVELGTATAPIYVAAERGVPVHVWVSETRPRNQGASLTTWELGAHGIPNTLVVDNAAGHLLRSGAVDLVITGADRIAANGDTANKIGTYLKAVAAADCGVPFHIAAPLSTVDVDCPDGASIPIEERSADEVLVVNGGPIAPAGTDARNWGFDVTPARLITSWLTDRGALRADEIGPAVRG
jgi:methylthioribose-1-phosphate isomerase